MQIETIILAAGKGTRMRSQTPKVLHRLGDKSLLAHVLDTALALGAVRNHVVYGHGGDAVRDEFTSVGEKTYDAAQDSKGDSRVADNALNFVLQEPQLGTGHAVDQAIGHVASDDAVVIVLYGDVPLIQSSTLKTLAMRAEETGIAVLTVQVNDATGYGRIVRNASGSITGIVEHRDADDAQRQINEINTGFIAARAGALRDWLSRLTNDNSQGEYYLTDIVALAVSDGIEVADCQANSEADVLGVNSKRDLALMERTLQLQQANTLMEQGVTLRDPARFDLRGTLAVGQDCEIDINVIIEGDCILGDRVRIGPNTVLRNSRVGDDSVIEANCVLENADVASHCSVGPFARLRPNARLEDGARVGNFVEIKNARLGQGAKANHLAYVGDADVGDASNIGAGVITCNYDGANKHQTRIGSNAFIGSNCALVAPVTIGDGATIGAGSVLSKNAPEGQLTLTRGRQQTLRGWTRPSKKNNPT